MKGASGTYASYIKEHSIGNVEEHTGFSREVSYKEIEKNEYNLNLPRYIDNQKREDIQDIEGHLKGGITHNHRSHPSIINYSLRLLNEDAQLLDSDSIRVFEKHIHGKFDKIASWIDSQIENIKKHYTVKDLSGFGILVRGNKTGELVSQYLNTKNRLYLNTDLEEHFSLWANR